LLYTFLTADADLDRYLGSGPLHMDDRPLLSYTTYGATYRTTIAGNLLELLAHRADVGQYVCGPAALLLRHFAASNEALMGHVAFFCGHETEALAHYLAGAKLLADDPAMQRLVVSLYAEITNHERHE
jgi:hypothetical protein